MNKCKSFFFESEIKLSYISSSGVCGRSREDAFGAKQHDFLWRLIEESNPLLWRYYQYFRFFFFGNYIHFFFPFLNILFFKYFNTFKFFDSRTSIFFFRDLIVLMIFNFKSIKITLNSGQEFQIGIFLGLLSWKFE